MGVAASEKVHPASASAGPASEKRYCLAAKIAPFRLEVLRPPKGLKLFHWVVLALLERGSTMTMDELVTRLRQVGVLRPDEDGAYRIKKAWHGLEPVYKTAQGLYGLDTGSLDLPGIAHEAGLARTDPVAVSPGPMADYQPPTPDVPLTGEELAAAFRNSRLAGISPLRQAAAVLDAAGRPMSLEEVDRVLGELTSERRPLAETGVGLSRSRMVTVDAQGRLVLDRSDPDVSALREMVRRRARPRLRQQAREQQVARERAAWEKHAAERATSKLAEAAALRRAIVRVVPKAMAPKAAAVLDVQERSLRTFIGEELAELPRILGQYDLLAGLNIRDTLEALKLDPERWRIVDLQPPRKTRKLNRAGRKLTITTEMLIAHTCGISRPLGDPRKVAVYLAEGDFRKLKARLESDVKALFAYYSFGVLQRYVRLRWGFLDECLPVEWAEEGDLGLYDILRKAQAEGKLVDLVAGSAPGWADPWSRARRVRVVVVDYPSVTVRHGEETYVIDRRDIQAARPVD